MTSVSDIPIEVINTVDAAQAPSPYLLALLQEIQDMLKEIRELARGRPPAGKARKEPEPASA